MDKNINFLELGKKKAEQDFNEFKKVAEQIEKEYGKDAKLEFEIGYSIAIGDRNKEFILETGEDILSEHPREIISGGKNRSYLSVSDVTEDNKEGFSR